MGDSIREVLKTLAEAILIVIIVIFLFLQGWRSTLIPAITIPVSLVGTFAFVKLFGFSINTLTLFGITLATGLVVDDAIVVIENMERHIEEGVTRSATRFRGRACAKSRAPSSRPHSCSIAVFVPVSFFPGSTGRLYQQFALTIAFSIAHLGLQRADAFARPVRASCCATRRQGQNPFFRAINGVIRSRHVAAILASCAWLDSAGSHRGGRAFLRGTARPPTWSTRRCLPASCRTKIRDTSL